MPWHVVTHVATNGITLACARACVFQADTAAIQFQESLKDYVRLTAAVKRVLDYRLERLGEFQAASRDLDQKKQRLTPKIGTDPKAKGMIDEAQQRVDESKEVFHSVSEMVRNEFKRFEAMKSHDIHETIVQFVQLNINLNIRVRPSSSLSLRLRLRLRLQDSLDC